MSRQIYRQEAVERLSSPEQLDLLMPVTNARGWVALLGVGVILLVGLMWGIFGRVTTNVGGTGVLTRPGGFEWIAAPGASKVSRVLVHEGDAVTEGQPVVELQILNAQGESSTQVIKSPLTGRVLYVAAAVGDFVELDMPLVSVEAPERPLRAIVYVPAGDGYRVQPGMDVQLLPATESRHNGAQLRGHVISAGKFPATRTELLRSFQNEQLASSMLVGGPLLEVVIEMDHALPKLFSGTPCQATITVESNRPISFLVPLQHE